MGVVATPIVSSVISRASIVTYSLQGCTEAPVLSPSGGAEPDRSRKPNRLMSPPSLRKRPLVGFRPPPEVSGRLRMPSNVTQGLFYYPVVAAQTVGSVPRCTARIILRRSGAPRIAGTSPQAGHKSDERSRDYVSTRAQAGTSSRIVYYKVDRSPALSATGWTEVQKRSINSDNVSVR